MKSESDRLRFFWFPLGYEIRTGQAGHPTVVPLHPHVAAANVDDDAVTGTLSEPFGEFLHPHALAQRHIPPPPAERTASSRTVGESFDLY